jgi:hypothetical protein
VAASHDGCARHATRLGQQDDRQDSADECEGASHAEGRGVALVEGAVNGAGEERDHQLMKEEQTTRSQQPLQITALRK